MGTEKRKMLSAILTVSMLAHDFIFCSYFLDSQKIVHAIIMIRYFCIFFWGCEQRDAYFSSWSEL